MALLDPHNLLLKSLRYFKTPMDKHQLEMILATYEQIKSTGNQTRLEDLDRIEEEVNQLLKK